MGLRAVTCESDPRLCPVRTPEQWRCSMRSNAPSADKPVGWRADVKRVPTPRKRENPHAPRIRGCYLDSTSRSGTAAYRGERSDAANEGLTCVVKAHLGPEGAHPPKNGQLAPHGAVCTCPTNRTSRVLAGQAVYPLDHFILRHYA